MNGLGRLLKSYLKLTYKSIDLSISNYMLIDILKGNISCYSDDDVEKIVCSFAYNNIFSYNGDYDVKVLPADEIDKLSKFKNTLGLLDKKNIYLQRETILDLKNKNIEILRVIFHEMTHIIQEKMIEENDISYRTYLLIMDRIIVNEIGKNYQINNYNFLFEEVDAKIMAEIQLYNFLSLNIPSLFYNIREELENNIFKVLEELKNTKRLYNKKYYYSEELLDNIINSNSKYLLYYPILNFYYYEDGTKVPISTIITRTFKSSDDIQEEIIMKKVKQMDEYIIENRSGNEYNINLDIESLNSLPKDDDDINKKKSIVFERIISLKNNNYANNIIDMYESMLNDIIENLLPNKIRKK